jgi:predicted nucleic acid-binding protein
MAEFFVDTSGWASLFEKSERFHAKAQMETDAALRAGDRLVTTNLVLIELTALLTRPLRIPKPRQIQLLADLRRDDAVAVISLDEGIEADAWRLWNQRPDKLWTVVDCASFVVMAERKIQRALTTDRHFEQAGFVRLLK